MLVAVQLCGQVAGPQGELSEAPAGRHRHKDGHPRPRLHERQEKGTATLSDTSACIILSKFVEKLIYIFDLNCSSSVVLSGIISLEATLVSVALQDGVITV